MLFGLMLPIVGTGLLLAGNELTAADNEMRFLVIVGDLLSVIDRPVVCSADNTCATVASGFCCFMTAHAPATCGVAIDVPDRKSNEVALFVTDELMLDPGASRSTISALFENDDTVFCLVVEPTVTAVEIQLGAPTAFVKPLLPDAITVAMLNDASWSMIGFSGFESQEEVNC